MEFSLVKTDNFSKCTTTTTHQDQPTKRRGGYNICDGNVY